MWLIKQKRYPEAVEVLKHIAKKNGKDIEESFFTQLLQALKENKLESQGSSKEELSQKLTFLTKIKILFGKKEFLKPLIILCMVSGSMFCVYFGMTTSVQDLGMDSVQANGIIVGITQAGGFILVLPFLSITRRKYALLLIQTLMLSGAFFLVCTSFFKSSGYIRLLEGFISSVYISSSLSALFSFLYIANAESFPTQIRGLAVGIILLVGKVIGSSAPYINLFSKQMKVHIMVGSSMPLFISIIATIYFRETIILAVGDKNSKKSQLKETSEPEEAKKMKTDSSDTNQTYSSEASKEDSRNPEIEMTSTSGNIEKVDPVQEEEAPEVEDMTL